MAEEFTKNKEQVKETTMDSTDRGLFDFMKKDENKSAVKEEAVISSGMESKVHVSEPASTEVPLEHDQQNKHGLLQKLHRSDSSSSSSSDEEGDDEEKKKRKKEKKEKKGLKEKIKEKLPGGSDHEEHKVKEEDTNVPIEKCSEEDKKEQGLLDKIKGKLPGGSHDDHQKKADHDHHVHDATAPPVVHTTEPCTTEGGDAKEKKGFLDKIKEKIPGFHSKNGDQEEKKEDIKREAE